MKNHLFAIATITLAFSVFANTESPYAGQDSREIKALSEQEVEGYLNGHGLGYARAAELNRYPGPRHVLDLAGELAISEEQTSRTQEVFDGMKTQAIMYGKRLVEKERELDQRFASASIDAATLETLVSEIGVLQAKIRYVHLNAHLEQRALLSKHQVQQYVQLRGYSTSHGDGHTHSD